MHPKITVLMSVFNAESFLHDAVDSVLNQSFKDFEFIIFDDKSSDRSLEILNKYRDERIVLIQNAQNEGLTKNLVRGMELAKGDYVARMDADDICQSHRLRTQLSFLEQNAEITVVGSAVIYFDGTGYESVARQPAEHDEIKCELLYGFTMLHPSVMFRKADFDRHGLSYNPHFVYSQDHDLWTRAIRLVRFANIQEPLLKMREHPMKIGRTKRPKQQELSNEVRKRQLDELGVKYEGAELIAFNRAADDRPPESSDELRHYEMILLKIFNSNRTRPIFYQQVLQLIAARRFRARCREALLKNKSWGRYYWRSKLRPFDAVTLREKAGLIFRSLSSL